MSIGRISSDNENNISQEEIVIEVQSKYVKKKLYQIHQNIYQITSLNAFKEGWKALESRHGKCTTTAYKVSAAGGGIIIFAFSATSIICGILAFKQGIEEYNSTGTASIVGHLSEWMMQAAFTSSVYYKLLNEVSVLGKSHLIQKIYEKILHKPKLTPQECHLIYEDYLELVDNHQQTTLVHIPAFPVCPKPLNEDGWQDRLLDLDYELQSIYSELDKNISQFSFLSQFQTGWKVINSQSSRLASAGLKITFVATNLFLIANLVNYPCGIYWAGAEAVSNLNAQENPSIAGHSFEWSVEWLATANILYYTMSEFANVGRAKHLSDLFQKKAATLMKEPANRILSELKRQIYALPKGLLSIPSWIMFSDETKES